MAENNADLSARRGESEDVMTYEDYAKKYGEVYNSAGEVFAICSEPYYLWTDARGYAYYQQKLVDKKGVRYVIGLVEKPEA